MSTPPDPRPAPGTSAVPQTVRTAVTLVWVAVGLYLLGWVVLLVSGRVPAVLAPTGSGGYPPPGGQALLLVLLVVVGGGVALLHVGAGAALALLLRAGRSWARVVLAVVAGLSALSPLLDGALLVAHAVRGPSLLVPVPPSAVQLANDALTAAALVAAVVLLFRRPSSAWFAQRRTERAARPRP